MDQNFEIVFKCNTTNTLTYIGGVNDLKCSVHTRESHMYYATHYGLIYGQMHGIVRIDYIILYCGHTTYPNENGL